MGRVDAAARHPVQSDGNVSTWHLQVIGCPKLICYNQYLKLSAFKFELIRYKKVQKLKSRQMNVIYMLLLEYVFLIRNIL